MRHNNRRNKRIDTVVTVYADECNHNPEKMIKRFSKQVKKSGIIDEYRERAFFTKPTAKRAEEKRARKRLIQKINKKRTELFTTTDRYKKRRRS